MEIPHRLKKKKEQNILYVYKVQGKHLYKNTDKKLQSTNERSEGSNTNCGHVSGIKCFVFNESERSRRQDFRLLLRPRLKDARCSGWPSHEHLLASSPLQHLDAEINTRPKPSKTPPWGICERKKLDRVTWHPCRERERPPGPSSPRWEIYHLTVGFGPQVQNDPPPPPQQPFAPMSCGEGSNKCWIFSWRTPHQWLFSHSVKTTTWFSPMQLWLLGATETVIVISSKTNLISLSKNAAVFQQLSWVRVVRGGFKEAWS